MSWWKSGRGAIIGDQPADVMTALMRQLDPFALPLLLGALTEGLRSQPTGVVADPLAAGQSVAGALTNDKLIAAADNDDDRIVAATKQAIADTSNAYRAEFDRPATTTEILAVATFVAAPLYGEVDGELLARIVIVDAVP